LNKGPKNPQGVFLIGGVGTADFSLSCGWWGGLFVSTNTTGVDLDADGYTVTVDGRTSQATATNGSVTFTMLDVGSHSIALSGAAGNCTVNGSNPQQVTVSAGGTASAPEGAGGDSAPSLRRPPAGAARLPPPRCGAHGGDSRSRRTRC